jgi:Na+-transporting methylmalonyl-CoA/oxaloacetate decarboxylase gamma subunit
LEEGMEYFWTVIPYDGCTFGTCFNGVLRFEVNARPVITKIVDQKGKAGDKLELQVKGTDKDDEDLLEYAIIEGPEGLMIDPETGMIEWTPKNDQVYLHAVTVQISDGYEQTTMSFKIDVKEGEERSSSSMGLYLTIIGVAVVIGILVFLVYFVKSRKVQKDIQQEEERTEKELEEIKKEQEYETMYGTPAPSREKEEESMTARELKDYIHGEIERLSDED